MPAQGGRLPSQQTAHRLAGELDSRLRGNDVRVRRGRAPVPHRSSLAADAPSTSCPRRRAPRPQFHEGAISAGLLPPQRAPVTTDAHRLVDKLDSRRRGN